MSTYVSVRNSLNEVIANIVSVGTYEGSSFSLVTSDDSFGQSWPEHPIWTIELVNEEEDDEDAPERYYLSIDCEVGPGQIILFPTEDAATRCIVVYKDETTELTLPGTILVYYSGHKQDIIACGEITSHITIEFGPAI